MNIQYDWCSIVDCEWTAPIYNLLNGYAHVIEAVQQFLQQHSFPYNRCTLPSLRHEIIDCDDAAARGITPVPRASPASGPGADMSRHANRCGKVYMANETVVPPGGQFQYPSTSNTPLLALRCNPALRPYLPEDSAILASIIVDTPVRYSAIAGAEAITLSDHWQSETLNVTASIDGTLIAQGHVSLNGTAMISFSLEKLEPRVEPYEVACTAVLGEQTFHAATQVVYLPSPPDGIGSVTKMDLRTGALLARPVGGQGAYAPIFPIGYYTDFDGYLATNLSLLDELKEQGFNIVHPVPSFDNLTAFDLVVEKMEELGLYLMYDMRWTYMNQTSVAEQVNSVKSRTNVLLYYTADEPDGTSDPLNATVLSNDLIRSLDPYRPNSLVLNCQDYYFSEYVAGADVILQDVYEIGNNVTWSNEWDTPCTPIQGDCGCDNCKGEFEDIRDRVEQFRERFEVLGWERQKAIWTVPQAFGSGQYWTRKPTGAEWLVEAIVGINAGARGVVSWNDPTTASIKAASSQLARAMQSMKSLILSPYATFRHVVTPNRVDLGVWNVGGKQLLVLATNLNYANASVGLNEVLGTDGGLPAHVLLDAGAEVQGENIVFGSIASGAWIFSYHMPISLDFVI